MARDPDWNALRCLFAPALAAAMLCGAPSAFGQPAGESGKTVSRPVVQPLPGREVLTLNEALSRLGKNPRDVDALIDAGKSALAIGDVEAAVGFFRRADQISPGNPQVKAGLARALVRSENPFEAIPMFEEAERVGAGDGAFMADRGLAYDLVGDNETAQRYYHLALAQNSSDEVILRLALSFAISGNRRAAETTLSPLLQQQDRGAWRTFAFALASLGQVDEAVAVAHATLPKDLADGISSYLRYMPRLTPAQQAAAANFGQFPRASEIGRDDPRVARFAPAKARRPAQAAADTALIPKGEALGGNARTSGNRKSGRVARQETTSPPAAAPTVRTAPPEPQPGRITAPDQAASQAAPAKPAFAAFAPAPMAPAAPPASMAATASAVSPPPLAVVPPAPPQASAPPSPVQPAATTPPPARQRSLAEAFSDLGRPTLDAGPVAGAVDVRRITPAREPAEAGDGKSGKEAKPKPAPPSHPSRIWVQIATGRDKAALAFDWRRMSREAAAVLRGKQPSVAAWGRTNRLLTGPFPTEAAANSFMAQLRRAGIDDPFIWTSPAGQVVDALPVR